MESCSYTFFHILSEESTQMNFKGKALYKNYIKSKCKLYKAAYESGGTDSKFYQCVQKNNQESVSVKQQRILSTCKGYHNQALQNQFPPSKKKSKRISNEQCHFCSR